MTSVIGLDIGSSSVRAAELELRRGKRSLVRFAQVGLASGAVVGGEVVDAAAVGAAIRRLWREGKFRSKRVIAGVAGTRTFARVADVPAMSTSDIQSSLAFQVHDLIPIPIEEAVIDHQLIEPFIGDDGSDRLRLLVVATHRDVVRSLLAALEAGGVSATRVDLVPLALVRALHAHGFADLDDVGGGTEEAIVDIGGGITNVIVHENGMPRFVRTLSTGGVELTDSIATNLDVPFDEAEALKRGIDDGRGDLAVQARRVTETALAPMVEDIRTSIEYWLSQSDRDLRQVIVTGGAARGTGVLERLEQSLLTTIVRADPLAGVDLKKDAIADDSVGVVSSVAAVAIGLALSGEALPAGSRRINLIPGDIADQRRARTHTMLAGLGVLGLAVLLLAVYSLRASQVQSAREAADAEEARTTELQQEIAGLQDVELLEAEIARRRTTAISVLDGDIAWTRLIVEVASVIPNDVWLTSFNGTRSQTGGQVTFSLMGFDHTSTARWIIRMSQLEALSSLWVPSSSQSGNEGQSLVTFSSNADLSPAAVSSRVAEYTGTAR